MRKVRFNLDKPRALSSYVLLSYSCTDRRLRYSTRIECNPEKWDKKKMRLKGRGSEERKLNAELDYIERAANAILLDFQKESKPIKAQQLRDRLDVELGRKDFDDRDQFEALRYILTYYQNDERPHVSAACQRIVEFIQANFKSLRFDDVDYRFMKEFHAFLLETSSIKSANTVLLYLSVIKVPMGQAFKEGLHNNQHYKSYNVPKPKAEAVYLNEVELEAISRLPYEVGSQADLVRDIFLIGAYTGLRVSDYINIKLSNAKTIENVNVLHIKQKKTKQDVYIPMRPFLVKLLKKYDFTIPKISVRSINKYLKSIAKDAGIDSEVELVKGAGVECGPKYKFISSHTARRSFATNAYLAGVPALAIMKITGHQTQTSFMGYICADSLTNAIHIADHGFFKDFRDRADNIVSIRKAS